MRGFLLYLLPLLFGVLALCYAKRSGVYPVVGCWEQVSVKGGHDVQFKQYWGYENINSEDVLLENGFDNYLIVDGNKMQSPVTRFESGSIVNDVFATRVSVQSKPAVWHLNGHEVHSRVGDNNHNCHNAATSIGQRSTSSKKHKAPVSASAAWNAEHPISSLMPHTESHVNKDTDVVQLSFHATDNGNCIRLPDIGEIVDAHLLDITLDVTAEQYDHSSTPIYFTWTVGSSCTDVKARRHRFAQISAPVRNAQLFFGLSDAPDQHWPMLGQEDFVPTDGSVYSTTGGSISTALQDALYDVSTTPGTRFLKLDVHSDNNAVSLSIEAAVLRLAYRPINYIGMLTANTAKIEPLHECTSLIDQGSGLCRSWFGYAMRDDSRSVAVRPVGTGNMFEPAPYDRHQITHFSTGLHRYSFSVDWNCTISRNPALRWIMDGSAVATVHGPPCRISCDGNPGGMKQYDQCGVCGGDGSTCDDAATASRTGGPRIYCDGNNEAPIELDFDTVRFGASRGYLIRSDAAHLQWESSASMALMNSASPPSGREALGTPNLAHGGPGVSDAKSAHSSNSEAQGLVLAFETPNQRSCMRARFDLPVTLHAVSLLNVQPMCTDSKVSNSSSIYKLNIETSSRCTTLEHCEAEKSYFQQGYTYSSWTQGKCTCDDECGDHDPCSADVCVHGCCMHAPVLGCCLDDHECSGAYFAHDSCRETFCCPRTHRCRMRMRPDCCDDDEDCEQPPAWSCVEKFCDERRKRCKPRGRPGCCNTDEECEELFDPEDQCSVGTCDHHTCVIRPKDCPSGLCVPSTGECVTASSSATPSLPIGASPSSTSSHTPFRSSSHTPSFGSSSSTTPSHTPFLSPSQTPSFGSSRSSTSTHTPFLSSSQTPSFGSSASPTTSQSPSFASSSASTPPFLSSSQTPSVNSSRSSTSTHTPFLSSSQTPSFGSSASTTPSHTPFLSSSQPPSVNSSRSSTNTHTPVLSSSQTPSFGSSASTTPSHTPFMSSSTTPSISSSQTPSNSVSASSSASSSSTSTARPSSSSTSTAGPSSSSTSTARPSSSPTSTAVPSSSPTSTARPSSSATSTARPSSSSTARPSSSSTSTAGPSSSSTSTAGPSSSSTSTARPSSSPTSTARPSSSPTSTARPSSSSTSTAGPSSSPTSTQSPSEAVSSSQTPDSSRTVSQSRSPGPSSNVPSGSPTPTVSGSSSSSASLSVGASPSSTHSLSSTSSASFTPTPSFTASLSVGASQSNTPSATPSPTPSLSVGSSPSTPPSCKPGWGFGDDNRCHEGPPPFSVSNTEGPQSTVTATSSPAPQGLKRTLRTANVIGQVPLPSSHNHKKRAVEHDYSKSSLVVTKIDGQLIKFDIPLSAANNGIADIALNDIKQAVSLELCMCDGDGAITELKYTHPGSGNVYDACGECGGTGTKCKQAHTGTVAIEYELSTNPIVVRQLGEGHGASYEICYYHQRVPSDREDFGRVAVRVGFEPYVMCHMRNAGSCDSSVRVPPEKDGVHYCDMFDGPHSQLNAKRWVLEPLAACVGLPLPQCPAGSGAGGYRMCATMPLADLTRCTDADGSSVLHPQDGAHSSVVYHGSLYATELAPINCQEEDACERILHTSMQRFAIHTSFSGRSAAVEFSSGDVDLDSSVQSVSCMQQSGDIRVVLQTVLSNNNGLYLTQPEFLEKHLSSSTHGVDFVIDENTHGCLDTTGDAQECVQTWSIRTLNAGLRVFTGEVRVGFLVHSETEQAHAIVAITAKLQTECGVAEEEVVEEENEEAEPERSYREYRPTTAVVELFRDREFLQAYTSTSPELQSFVDNDSVYGRVQISAPYEVLQHAHKPELVIDDLYVCYSPQLNVFLEFDTEQPYETGCMSPGQWVTTILMEDEKTTSDGKHLHLELFEYDDSPLHAAFVFQGHASTDAPVYMDVRWHLQWYASSTHSVTAEEMATVRLAQHKASARLSGRNEADWGEESNNFHAILPPRVMQQTARIKREGQREHARLSAAHGVAYVAGMTIPELKRSLSGRYDLHGALQQTDDALIKIRSSPAADADVSVYPAFDDEQWSGGAVTSFYARCPEEKYISSSGNFLTRGQCSPCHGRCPHGPGHFHPPCATPNCRPDFDECPWDGCHKDPCWNCLGDSDCDWWVFLVFWLFMCGLGLLFLVAFICPSWLWCGSSWLGCDTDHPYYCDDGHHKQPSMITIPHKKFYLASTTALVTRKQQHRVVVPPSPQPTVTYEEEGVVLNQDRVTAGTRRRTMSPGSVIYRIPTGILNG